MSIDVVLGTRPEIIKLAPVMEALGRRGIRHRLIHTGQHYSPEMDRVFFDELRVRRPALRLDVGSATPAAQIGRMMAKLEEAFVKGRPGLVMVQGDTNTVLAGALAAAKLNIPVAHVEAGLRCFDPTMIEEQNRVLADHVSTLHFAVTKVSKANLAREGIRGRNVSVVGNTIVDAVRAWLPAARAKLGTGNPAQSYVLATVHRQENVDDPTRLRSLLQTLARVGDRFNMDVVYPVHPRTRKRIRQHRIVPGKRLRLVEPMGYLEFLATLERSRLVLTDSGGVQEEACVLRVPCVTLRETTERPESVTVGANIVAGVGSAAILRATSRMWRRPRRWRTPFGDGHSGERIALTCERWLAKPRR